MNPKLDSGFPLEVSPSFWISCTPIKPGFSGKGRLEKLACVPLACSTFRLANQVSHGQVKAGAGKTLSPCAQQPKPPRLLSSHWHNKCSKIKMFPESGFHTVSLGSPKHPPHPHLCLQPCQLPVPYSAVVLTMDRSQASSFQARADLCPCYALPM